MMTFTLVPESLINQQSQIMVFLRNKLMQTVSCDSQRCTSMGLCKKDVIPLLTHWSYVFLALTHQYAVIITTFEA